MRYKIFSSTHKAVDAMYSAILDASSSVYLEMYIFLNDTFPTHNFYQLLTEKAASGVTVKIIIDAIGSSTAPYAEIEKMRKAGAEVIVFREWFRRTHRKILVVDEKIGFIGGVNIGQQYMNWLDLHAMVTGRIVQALVDSFAKSYRKSGGTDPRLTKRSFRNRLRTAKTWVYDHIPGGSRNILGRYYRETIRRAKQSIQIITPYFIPNPWIVRELEAALGRGVRIEVVMPEHTNPLLADLPNRVFMRALYPKGAEFFLTKTMLHAKALIVDGEEAALGSQNLDGLSFNYNLETGLLFRRRDMVRDIMRIVERWKKQGIKYDPATDTPRWYDSLVAFLAAFLQPVL